MAFFIQINAFIIIVYVMGINRVGKRRDRSKVRLLGVKNVIVSFYLPTTILSFIYISIKHLSPPAGISCGCVCCIP